MSHVDVAKVVRSSERSAALDNLKVLLVAGVIVAHATFAWTGVGTWVFREGPLREPAQSVVTLIAVVGGLFGLALFFLISGLLTPPSLARKGTRRFLVDRGLRLGLPMLFFMLVLSPVVEYVDPDNAGWSRGFAAFAVRTWWPPVPGPTWFLGVLLLFTVAYALVRLVRPRGADVSTALRGRHLLAAAAAISVGSYLVRLWIPLGEERLHLALGQAPAWVMAFALGVAAGERGWLDPVPPWLVRASRRAAWAAVAALVGVFTMGALTGNVDVFGGGGTWQSLLVTVPEAGLVLGMSLWLLDVFRRRFDHQGPVLRECSRAAYGAFLIHQVVLVALVLATHHVAWPAEVEFLAAGALGVVGSFGLAALLIRIPLVSRVL